MQLIPTSLRIPLMVYFLNNIFDRVHDDFLLSQKRYFFFRGGGGCSGVVCTFAYGAPSLVRRSLLRAGVQLLDTAAGHPIRWLRPGAPYTLAPAPWRARQIAEENAAELRKSFL